MVTLILNVIVCCIGFIAMVAFAILGYCMWDSRDKVISSLFITMMFVAEFFVAFCIVSLFI